MALAASSAGTNALTKRPSSSSSFRLHCPSLNTIRLRRIFDLFDKNRDGMISICEMCQALALLGLDAETTDLNTTIMPFIQPSNDGLEFDDFVSLHQALYDTYFGYDDSLNDEEAVAAAAAEEPAAGCDGNLNNEAKMTQEESDLKEAFKVFDEDGDGYISAKEFQVVLSKLGFEEANEIYRVEKMTISVDHNHGLVDLFEIKDMMRNTFPARKLSCRQERITK